MSIPGEQGVGHIAFLATPKKIKKNQKKVDIGGAMW